MGRNLPYKRADRVAEQIYQVVASYIYRNVDDERLTGVQITRATMTNDLSIVKIYYYIEGGRDKQQIVQQALDEIKSVIRGHVGKEVVLRLVPKVEFYLDEGLMNAERIEELLKTVNSK
jgi:ribosome-binding factor A